MGRTGRGTEGPQEWLFLLGFGVYDGGRTDRCTKGMVLFVQFRGVLKGEGRTEGQRGRLFWLFLSGFGIFKRGRRMETAFFVGFWGF